MTSFSMVNKHGYSIKFSPFNPNHLAVASNENFGITGSGWLSILNINRDGTIQDIDNRHWPDGLYDLTWSKKHFNYILSASGDSSIQCWNLDVQTIPIKTYLGHCHEVSSVDWSCNDLILSSSWDSSIKLWDPNRSTCLSTFLGNFSIVFEATFSANAVNLFASVSEEGNMRLWDTLNPHPVASVRTHDSEVLSCDWCKYNTNLIVTCGSDSLIRGWDIRNYRQPIFQLKGSDQAVKRIRFSPHYTSILASCSFDHVTKIWAIRQQDPIEVFKHHSEFVYGLDWNSYEIGELADCSWDNTIMVFKSETIAHVKNKI